MSDETARTKRTEDGAEVIPFANKRLERDFERFAEALGQPPWVVTMVIQRAIRRLEARRAKRNR